MSGLEHALIILLSCRTMGWPFYSTKMVWEHWGRRAMPARRPLLCNEMSNVGQKPVGLLP